MVGGLKPFGQTLPLAFMLQLVLARPGLSQHEIADQLTFTRPTATRLLDGLQALGGRIGRRQNFSVEKLNCRLKGTPLRVPCTCTV